MNDIFWTPEAIHDRESIYEFIVVDNPTAALALDEHLEIQASSLLDQPSLGRPGRVAGTREWVAHPNYILVYDLTGECIRILRVIHAAIQWPN